MLPAASRAHEVAPGLPPFSGTESCPREPPENGGIISTRP
jgi:hypothetical protein